MESARCQGEVWITDGAAPVTLDGESGAASAGEANGSARASHVAHTTEHERHVMNMSNT